MINAYKKLWQHRAAVQSISSEAEMEQQILIELNDELTHPRVRKSKGQKLALALERIEQANITDEEKEALKSFYKEAAAE
ncbi:MAG TPA: hypothetical protein VK947_02750 [Planococcus sp. (in: firmicutes)]|nr:hypothetical protein [Planococcus sp. (in: firmicutes)]